MEKNPKQQDEVNRQQSEDGCDEWYVEDKGASNPNIVAYKRRYEAMEISHYENVDICKIAWYKIIGVSMSMYVLYKSNNKQGCWFLPHGNKGTHKLQMSTNQTESNVQSLIHLTMDIMSNQMKGIGLNGRQDVRCLLHEFWKSFQKWSDKVIGLMDYHLDW